MGDDVQVHCDDEGGGRARDLGLLVLEIEVRGWFRHLAQTCDMEDEVVRGNELPAFLAIGNNLSARPSIGHVRGQGGGTSTTGGGGS
jgi:hypothetical protein